MKENLLNDGINGKTPVRIVSDSRIMKEMLSEVLSWRFSVTEGAAELTVICVEGEAPRCRGECIIISDKVKNDGALYLPRPVDIKLLLESAVKLTSGSAGLTGLGYVADRKNCTVSLNGVSVRLTPKEFDLFSLLAERCPEAVSEEEICALLWQGRKDGSNICGVYASYLRKKLERLYGPGAVVSVRGKGYMLGDAVGKIGERNFEK